MRLIVLLSALVLVVGENNENVAPTFIEANEGSSIHMFIPPKTDHNIEKCQIQDPQGEIFEFFPYDRLVDLSLVPSAISRVKDCAIDIRLSKVAHSGQWALIAARKARDGTIDETKKNFLIFVKGRTNKFEILPTRRFVLKEGDPVTITIPKENESILNYCELKDPTHELVKTTYNGDLDECKIDFQAKENHIYGLWTLQSSYLLLNRYYDQRRQPFFAVLEGQKIDGKAELLTRITIDITVGDSAILEIRSYQIVAPTCYLTQPDSKEFNLENVGEGVFLDISVDPEVTNCNVHMNSLSHEMAGDWILVAVYDEGSEDEFHYIQPYTIRVANIEVPVNRLNPRGFIVDVGGEFTVSVPYNNDYSGSCYLTNQGGEIIQLRPMNEHTIENIELHDGDTECTVSFKDLAMSQGGDWSLSSTFYSTLYEKHNYIQPFTIFFRGQVNTVPSSAVTIQEGENLYLRLRNPIEGLTNCRVDAPVDDVIFETDTRFGQHCGIVVYNVSTAAGGMWHIFATGLRPENGAFLVEVTELELEDEPIKHIIQHRPATLSFGPPSAVYCDVRDGQGTIRFRGFGPCLVELERANIAEHTGTWRVSIGLPGRMALLQRTYNVRVTTYDYDVISAYVLREIDTTPTSLNCRMWTTAEVRTCAFRRPDGQVFMMHDGVSSGRYSFYGDGTEEATVGVMTSCGISIDNLNQEDLGTWQCMIETSERTNTGFMTVEGETGHGNLLSVSTSGAVRTVAGSPIRLSCSIQAPIRYCLFRHPNGTIISPLDEQLWYEFGDDGTRLDAGVCAMQIYSANLNHMGNWECILGTIGSYGGRADLTWPMTVHVFASALVLRTEGRQGTRGLLMEASTYDQSAVVYCRYIRPDGLSFNEKSDMALSEYVLWNTNIELGICSLVIQSTNNVDIGEWMIAVKRVGHNREDIVRVDLRLVSGVSGMSIWIMVLSVIALTLLFLSCMGLCLNRRRPGWVRQKAVFVRNSFRRKQPPQPVTTNGP